ncbi:hypothetical protein B0T24DRAFT_636109 [Lasiosphaeria ovina]|uniref:F-box domain-containing protein n=1 Tax=Lasiosphaeria ovina TaxID=92902 RepID=A0AAE0JWA7_9PEZI|nr:hypothetical protein B0T24DRAFT_636109 [Lasiosphaeria ovina]
MESKIESKAETKAVGSIIDVLPVELIRGIFSCTPEPLSHTRLHGQPAYEMLQRAETPLKNMSLVSKRWRDIALPILFGHVVWVVEFLGMIAEPLPDVDDPIDNFPLLHFLRHHGLARHVDSLTLIVRDFDRSPPALVSASELDGYAASSSLEAKTSYDWLWDLVFGAVDPRTFTMIAMPDTLGSLLSRAVWEGDAWTFDMNTVNILSLARPAATRAQLNAATSSSPKQGAADASSPTPQTAPASKLFTIRPWTHLLLNEGSFTPVYGTHEFFLRRPPSILPALLGCDSEAPPGTPRLIPPTIKSLSYVAIFPLSSHVNMLATFLPCGLDHLSMQLMPDIDNNILHNPREMHHVQLADLWLERNTCYSLIMAMLLEWHKPRNRGEHLIITQSNLADDDEEDPDDPWASLREFETGDSRDEEAWNLAVQQVQLSRAGWLVERRGKFVRGLRRRVGVGAWDASTTSSLWSDSSSVLSPEYLAALSAEFPSELPPGIPFSP